jgi:glycosyltransferase involved in cell wall biosynthesis
MNIQEYTPINSSIKIELPIHFFTIVLNGQPYIPYHIDIFKQLPFQWHWHIIEGVANLTHDTAWSVELGGEISNDIHRNGLSNDGTTEYLDELAQLHPEHVTIYRKPPGIFWDGKREMVNAPLVNIQAECLLWQVDVDELWTVEQLKNGRQLFIRYPLKTAAFYWCWYFVGQNLIIGTRHCYGQNPQQEWLRTWRFKPGAVWIAHEPPILAQPDINGEYVDIAKINPFLHPDTEKNGLIFQHFAYVTKAQLLFKEQYYGYQDAVAQWEKLQLVTKFPVFLRDYFAWVKDKTQVDLAESRGIVPIAQKDEQTEQWHFLQLEQLDLKASRIKRITPTVAIDGVFFQTTNLGIARVWKNLLQQWVENGFAKHLLVIDRDGTAPQIDGINYCSIDRYEWEHVAENSFSLQEVCDRYQIDLFMSTYYTTPISTPSILLVHDMIPEMIGVNLNVPVWQEKEYAIHYASKYIAVSNNTARDLHNLHPHIKSEDITLAYNGISAIFTPDTLDAINQFRITYKVTKPYFIIVGERVGLNNYKNIIHFFRAVAKLPERNRYEIVCVGGSPTLEPELVQLSTGIRVHKLNLSDRELQSAYSGAVALVYPSKYEGFGLPVLEAMSCGCPVITCNNSSLPEIAGDSAIYVSETNIDELVIALEKVQQPKVRQELINNGLQQAKQFSWQKMADTISEELMNAYSQLQQGQLTPVNPIWKLFRQWQTNDSHLELIAAREKIESMETSKFWKLRQQWFKFKNKVSFFD